MGSFSFFFSTPRVVLLSVLVLVGCHSLLNMECIALVLLTFSCHWGIRYYLVGFSLCETCVILLQISIIFLCCFNYDMSWRFSFFFLSFWCVLFFFICVDVPFLHFKKFSSLIFLKIWTILLAWDSSSSSISITWDLVCLWCSTFSVCSFPVF